MITEKGDGGLVLGTPGHLPLEPEARRLTPNDEEAARVRYEKYIQEWEDWVRQMLEDG